MKKLMRTKLLIGKIESEIERNQRRIATLSTHNFELRKSLEGLKALPPEAPLTKEELEARDKANRVGKYFDAAYHEEQRLSKQKISEENIEMVLTEANKTEAATLEAIEDSADQEIGMGGQL